MGRGVSSTQGMNSTATGPGGGGAQVVMPGGQAPPQPAGIIDAVSEIQQFYVIEKTGQDLQPEFLTLRGVLIFMMIGLKSGFVESFIFSLLIPVVMTFSTSMIWDAYQIHTDWFLQFLMYLLAFAPVFINTFLCAYLSRFYIGNLTRRAINCLLNGRTMALFVKGLLVLTLFLFASKWLTDDKIRELMAKVDLAGNERVFTITASLVAKLPQAAWVVLMTTVTAIAVPFITVYWRDYAQKKKVEHALNALDNA